jgi:hypothetical protein
MEIKDKSSSVDYLVRGLAGVVLVFVIGIQLNVLAHWK